MQTKLSFYKNLFENLSDMIVIIEQGTQAVVECNQVLLNKLGYSRKELLGLPSVLSLYHPRSHQILKRAFEICDTKGCCQNIDLELQTKLGKKIPVSLILSRTKGLSTPFSFLRNVKRDIIKSSKIALTDKDTNSVSGMADQVKDCQLKCQELEHRNRNLDTFACLMTHDLKGPLRHINSLIKLLKEDTSNRLSETSEDYLLDLQRIIHKMNVLMNDIIFYFLIDQNVSSLEQLNLQSFIHSIFDVMDIPQGFQFVLKTGIEQITVKKLPLQQVLYNLFNNAIKHHQNPDQGQIKIDIQMTSKEYIFHISDNGPGIPKKFHHDVFQPFKRLSTGPAKEGTGLGLAIVQKIVTKEKGHIQLCSGSPSGTTFILKWPRLSN